ncbi:hypothetical protein AVEN_73233-1 [Araneus ventricosus]|uniref:Uncharacterized protein n=1 Tax=Araneus ventricosus TaxID=182803 RepID=A0A4Y1ZQG1_ARAVE|nr:hypothetical protein AVEN_73233-1 [Araneus ventricosus]
MTMATYASSLSKLLHQTSTKALGPYEIWRSSDTLSWWISSGIGFGTYGCETETLPLGNRGVPDIRKVKGNPQISMPKLASDGEKTFGKSCNPDTVCRVLRKEDKKHRKTSLAKSTTRLLTCKTFGINFNTMVHSLLWRIVGTYILQSRFCEQNV